MNELQFASARACSPPGIWSAKEYFGMYHHVIANLPYQEIESIISALMMAYENEKNIFTFGNGGSAALASHFGCDMGKGASINENSHRRFRVMALTDNVPLMTAWANDNGYEQIFAEQLQNFIEAGDVAFAISGSGNSPNVLRALEVARNRGGHTIGLTGFEGGKMKGLCELCVVIPSNNMQIIEDLHLGVAHAVFSVMRQRISGGHQQKRATSGAAD
jgi:D-sedoheptulose 7-phosphate isomerase